jgi:two-component system phosphate regulon sensor histidine kinase PhoR
MILAKRKIGFAIALLTASLAGLVVVQAYLLWAAVDLKERVFRNSVQAALTAAAHKLEAAEVVDHVYQQVYAPGADSGRGDPLAESFRWKVRRDSLCTGIIASRAILVQDPDGANGQHAGGGKVIVAFTGGAQVPESALVAAADSAKRSMVERVMVDLFAQSRAPITERFSIARIDSAVGASLQEAGIGLAFATGLRRAADDSLVAVSDERYREELGRSGFRASLFPLEFVQPFHELTVHFPQARAHLWLQIWPLLACSLLFTLIVVYCFAQAIRTIAAQQRFAEQIVGFINNMTHEFKTPISTIALATEAIARPEVEADAITVRRYNLMIGDENRRMRAQVEKILQMAQLERGDFQLTLEEVDVHAIITRALGGFALRIEQRRGTLARDLAAARTTVRGDRVHLEGVIGNLLDNAIKYSAGPPEIGVRTSNDGSWIVITISDHGAGIPAEYHARVFEKYFRCPTGERHDVKGFGLGLSYVKLLTGAHGGRVDLESRVGEGTRVTLRLPLSGTDAGSGS